MIPERWRSPAAILASGSLILMLSLGTRQSFGLFMQPMTSDLGWGREVFAFSLGLQNLVWGLAQPFAGMVADKYGAARVAALSGLLYCIGLALMATTHTPLAFGVSAGLLLGLGLSGSAFGVVMGVVGRAFPPEKRSMAFGVVGAGGSFGQFIMLPYGQVLISNFGWVNALLVLAACAFLMVPLSAALAGTQRGAARTPRLSLTQAIHEAATHRGFWYLTSSFLVCGFQTAFILVHLPAYLLDGGLSALDGMTALAVLGIFNILGSYLAGSLGGHYSKKFLLTWIYVLRAIAIAAYIALPLTPWSTWIFAALMGLLWLGTVPLTNGLVAQIFGVRYLSTLFSLAFLGHQIGAFAGAWYGGYIYDLSGSYLTVRDVAIGASVVAAILCLPIDERSVDKMGSDSIFGRSSAKYRA